MPALEGMIGIRGHQHSRNPALSAWQSAFVRYLESQQMSCGERITNFGGLVRGLRDYQVCGISNGWAISVVLDGCEATKRPSVTGDEKMKNIMLVTAACICVAGCVSTQEMPLAPNVVRIDTKAGGLLFVNRAVPETLRAAANATLARGYTHFRLQDANLAQGSSYIGSIGNVSGTYGDGSYSAWGSSTAIRRPEATSAATVIMFNARDPQAKGAFRAEDILKQYPQ